MACGLYPDIEESDGKHEKAKRTAKYMSLQLQRHRNQIHVELHHSLML
jgi:hypothetical protein